MVNNSIFLISPIHRSAVTCSDYIYDFGTMQTQYYRDGKLQFFSEIVLNFSLTDAKKRDEKSRFRKFQYDRFENLLF